MEFQEKFINSTKTSKLLGIHRYTLNRWILRHKKDKDFRCPPYYLMGGHYKFKKSEIDNFINESRNFSLES